MMPCGPAVRLEQGQPPTGRRVSGLGEVLETLQIWSHFESLWAVVLTQRLSVAVMKTSFFEKSSSSRNFSNVQCSRNRTKALASVLIVYHGRKARGSHGLLNVSPGPARSSTYCGRATPKSFRGGPPTGQSACGCHLPLWTPHAVHLCCLYFVYETLTCESEGKST
jgi:hypothetical protein